MEVRVISRGYVTREIWYCPNCRAVSPVQPYPERLPSYHISRVPTAVFDLQRSGDLIVTWDERTGSPVIVFLP